MSAEPSVTVGPGEVSLHWGPGPADLAIVAADGVRMLQRSGSVRPLGDHTDVERLVWSPDGHALALVVSRRGRHTVRAISARDGALQWAYERDDLDIHELRWSPDGRSIAVVRFDLLVLDADSGAVHLQLHPRAHGEDLDDIVWSPGGRYLLLRSRTLPPRGGSGVFRVCAAADGETVAIGPVRDGDYIGWTDGGDELLFCDGPDRLATRSTAIPPQSRRSLVYTDDGAHAAAEGDRHVLWIERPTGLLRIDGHSRTITALVLTARGDVATGCRDGVVRLVRAGSQQLQQLWQAPAGERVDALAWSDDGAWLAVKSHARVYLVAVP